MDNFFIITNEHKDPHMDITSQIINYLTAHGKKCYAGTEIPENTQCIIVLGGDGTLLKAAQDNVDKKIPLIGVNLGTLGFMAEVDVAGLDNALDALIRGDYQLEERMMLTGTFLNHDGSRDKKETYALNDIVITRGSSYRIISFNLYEQFLYHYNADGIIISTPTGSTGYNLSAGGPIVDPKAKMMVLTPVCPHTINTRSIVLSAQDHIVVEIAIGKDGQQQEVELYYDGSKKSYLKTGDRIHITQSEKITDIVKLNKASFLEILNKKMSE